MSERCSQSAWEAMLIEDTALISVEEPWHIRYRIQRSAEGQQYQEPNQDCARIQASVHQVAFTICDGVSLSFCGQLSAQELAYNLTHWMYMKGVSCMESSLHERTAVDADEQAATSRISTASCSVRWKEQFSEHLARIRAYSAEKVAAFELPESLSPMVRDVLEEKRSKGSECIYLSGVMDRDVQTGDIRLLLVWQGDIRARLWIDEREVCLRSETQIRTEERWSTAKGMIGDVHMQSYCLSLSGYETVRLALYTDGLSLLDKEARLPEDQEINKIFWHSLQRPDSDDMTYLEIGSQLVRER